jgi:hypothetical protein
METAHRFISCNRPSQGSGRQLTGRLFPQPFLYLGLL